MQAELPPTERDPTAAGLVAPAVQGKARLGPLLLTRYRKRDGRALLLFKWVESAERPPKPATDDGEPQR